MSQIDWNLEIRLKVQHEYYILTYITKLDN